MTSSWLLYRLILRNLKAEWGRTLLALFSIALGVSVFLAIRLANRSAVASFVAFTNGVGQGSDYVVRTEAGPLMEKEVPNLEPILGQGWIRPIIEGNFSLKETLESFQLLGTDLIGVNNGAESEDSAATPSSLQQQLNLNENFYDSIQDPLAVLISSNLSKSMDLKRGSTLQGYVNETLVTLNIVGVLAEAPNRPSVQRNIIVMDLPAAQALLGRYGELDRLDIGLRSFAKAQDLEYGMRALFPKTWVIEPAEQRASSGRTMSAAFRFNLTILSLIALAVGGYLLFQSFDATVNRRRETWATLVALGCPPQHIQRLILSEATVLGLLGSGLGVILGWGLAQLAVRGVSQTLDALYGASAAREASLLMDEALIAFVLGFLACMIAAWIPARKASQSLPIQFLARGNEQKPMRWRYVSTLGLVILIVSLLIAYLPEVPPGVAWHVYLSAFLMILGGSLLSVGFLPLIGLPGRWMRHWKMKLALRPLLRPSGRHGFAAAALSVAVGMTVGMGIMVQSFEGTVQSWISTNLHADLYIAPVGAIGAASKHRMNPDTVDRIEQDRDIEAVDRFQIIPVQMMGNPTFVGAGDLSVEISRRTMVMVEGGDTKEIFQNMISGGLESPGAMISETFSRRFGIKLNQVLEIPTPQGPKKVAVRAIFADYGNERGSLILHRPVFTSWFLDDRSASLAVYLNPGVDSEQVAQRLAQSYPGLQVRSNRSLRMEVTRIFNQTFAITYALEIIGCLVAIAGLMQALVGLAFRRRNELWTLRSMGVTEETIAQLLAREGLGIALAGGLAGTLLGLGLSRILVDVLNPQVFGWTLKFVMPWTYIGLVIFLSLGSSLLAMIPVARWASRIPADREAEEGA